MYFVTNSQRNRDGPISVRPFTRSSHADRQSIGSRVRKKVLIIKCEVIRNAKLDMKKISPRTDLVKVRPYKAYEPRLLHY
jgi:hypothetical protein